MMFPKRLKSATILLSSIFLSAHTPPKAHVTGFFTDMHYIEEGGDVVGMEV